MKAVLLPTLLLLACTISIDLDGLTSDEGGSDAPGSVDDGLPPPTSAEGPGMTTVVSGGTSTSGGTSAGGSGGTGSGGSTGDVGSSTGGSTGGTMAVVDEGSSSTGEPAPCGNGSVDPGEQCDGTELQGIDCTLFGLENGELACDVDQCTFDLTGCLDPDA